MLRSPISNISRMLDIGERVSLLVIRDSTTTFKSNITTLWKRECNTRPRMPSLFHARYTIQTTNTNRK